MILIIINEIIMLTTNPKLVLKIIQFANFNLLLGKKWNSLIIEQDTRELFILQLKRFIQLTINITPAWHDLVFDHLSYTLLVATAVDKRLLFKLEVEKIFSLAAAATAVASSSSSNNNNFQLCASVILRKIFETIAVSPLEYSKTRKSSFRKFLFETLLVLQMMTSDTVSHNDQDEDTNLVMIIDSVCSKMKLPLQHRVTSPDSKCLAVAIGKEVYLYNITTSSSHGNNSSSRTNQDQESFYFFDLMELGTVKPKTTGKGFLEDSSSASSNCVDQTSSTTKNSKNTKSNAGDGGDNNLLLLQKQKYCAYRSVFSNDSRILAVSCLDGSIRFGDANTGQLKATLEISSSSSQNTPYTTNSLFFIEALCFSKDDQFLYFCAGTRIFIARVFDDEGFLEPHIVSIWRADDEEDEQQEQLKTTEKNNKIKSSIVSSSTAASSSHSYYYINNLISLTMIPNKNLFVSCNGDDCSMSILEFVDNNNNSSNISTPSFRVIKKIFNRQHKGTTNDDDDKATSTTNDKWFRDCCCCCSSSSSSTTENKYLLFAVTNDRYLRRYEILLVHQGDDKNEQLQQQPIVKVQQEEQLTSCFLLTQHKSKIFGISISPDQHLLATGSLDGDIRIFDIDEWKERSKMILKGDGFGLLTCFSFPPSSSSSSSKKNNQRYKRSISFLVTGSHLNMTKIWRIDPLQDESQCIRVINFDSSVLSIAFAPTSSLSGEKMVLTDYYGARRFFGIVVSSSASKNNSSNKKMVSLKKCTLFPLVRIQFVQGADDDDDEQDYYTLLIEDLMGETEVVKEKFVVC